MALFTSPEAWISFFTLTVMEIVLGIDNIIFISILSGRLPEAQRPRARKTGLGLALGSRLVLLFGISWIVGLTRPLFHILSHEVTGKSLVLLAGGLFLMYKATHEIHEKLEAEEHTSHENGKGPITMKSVLIQILILDMVFSIDSVITAVGMSPHIAIMVAANVAAVFVMLLASRSIAEFVERHPTVKMLALSFLLLIGFTLTLEAAHVEVPKGYIYFAMGFSVLVEALNLRAGTRAKPVQLRNTPG
ncbi:MAG: TerC family protein [Candidatus Hydrogenedentota bacterium]